MKQKLTEDQLHLFNTVQDLRKEYKEIELTKKQIAEILVQRGYATSEVSLYNRIARIREI